MWGSLWFRGEEDGGDSWIAREFDMVFTKTRSRIQFRANVHLWCWPSIPPKLKIWGARNVYTRMQMPLGNLGKTRQQLKDVQLLSMFTRLQQGLIWIDPIKIQVMALVALRKRTTKMIASTCVSTFILMGSPHLGFDLLLESFEEGMLMWLSFTMSPRGRRADYYSRRFLLDCFYGIVAFLYGACVFFFLTKELKKNWKI